MDARSAQTQTITNKQYYYNIVTQTIFKNTKIKLMNMKNIY